MAERTSDRWVSIVLSVLLHGAVVAALGYGWWTYKHRAQPPVAQTLGIEAVALDIASAPGKAKATPRPPEPAPTPPPEPEPEPEPVGPPAPVPDDAAQQEEAQRQEEEKRKAD